MLEAIDAVRTDLRARAASTRSPSRPRIGDHRWWISDLDALRADYPGWRLTLGIEEVLREIHEQNVERWIARYA